MKALILNSGMGSRMGVLTSEHPKCMTEVSATQTILSRQLYQLYESGIYDVVITTGYFDDVLVKYCKSLNLPLNITFVKNPEYDRTNYIYSIYCAREFLKDSDVILMHGDLVFENSVFEDVLCSEKSCMTVSTTLPLPEKDFKAVLYKGRITKVGVEFFNSAVAAQPLYKILKDDWNEWLDEIVRYCQTGIRSCYAENAFNDISDKCKLYPMDVKDALCGEIDNAQDLEVIYNQLHEVENRLVYMCFSTDIIHGGHISIINKAKKLGKVVIGILTDEAVEGYKSKPFFPLSERKLLIGGLSGVYKVVEQNTLSYAENIRNIKPAIVVHGDDWKEGDQQPIREEVLKVLSEYGGKLVEYPYSKNEKYEELQKMLKNYFPSIA